MNNELYGLRKNILNEIIYIGEEHNIQKITLFGSRARGDYKERSDIDLAVYGGDADGFAIVVEEKVSTLLKFDVVDMNKPVQKELMYSIEKEGVVIYEKV